jgi:hypothetical protein
MAAKKAKKRGVKPGTKRGPYKRTKRKIKVSGPYTPNEMLRAIGITNSVGSLPSLISELTSTIDTLEAQLTAQIDRIKSILV